MIFILPMHEVNKSKLKKVISKMKKLGSPTIRVYWDEPNGIFIALEGTHRLQAASLLGLPIDLQVLEEMDIINDTDIDRWDLGLEEDEDIHVTDILDYLGAPAERDHLMLEFLEEDEG